MNQGGSDPALAAPRVCLLFLAEAPVTTIPSEATLYDTPFGENRKTVLLLQFGHDSAKVAELTTCAPVLEPALVAHTGPNSLELGIAFPVKLGEPPPSPVWVLYSGLMHALGMDQLEDFYGDAALSVAYVLASIVASAPPSSVVLIDWLSSTGALGGSSPSTGRPLRPFPDSRISWIFCHCAPMGSVGNRTRAMRRGRRNQNTNIFTRFERSNLT